MMSIRSPYMASSFALLVAGLVIESIAPTQSTTPWVPPDPHEQPGHTAELSEVGDTLEIDVGALQVHLGELRFDERPEQIADWAVLGVLSASDLDADTLRAAISDMPQLRFPELDEVFTFDYGRGRRVLLPDGHVWLFHSDADPAPRATLARLADKVRMETQELPTRFRVLRYRSSLVDGVIEVTREADIESARMFSAEYGYHEAQVSSLADLEDWLGRVDDVTYMSGGSSASGEFTIGGRRVEEHRTANLTLEDIAALYQAHASLKVRRDEIDKRVRKELVSLIGPLEMMIDLYNARATSLSRYAAQPELEPDAANRFILAANNLARDIRQMFAGEDLSALPPVDGRLRRLDRANAFIDAVQPFVQRAYDEQVRKVQQDLAARGERSPDAPGFSLDPQWNVPNLIADLELLMTNPGRLVAMAREIALQRARHNASAMPILVWAAGEVASMFPQETRFQVPPTWKKRLGAIIRDVRGKSGVEAEEIALVGYRRLLADLRLAQNQRPTSSIQAARVRVLLELIAARNRMQCARYDGPLQGTRVGMTLFYTDLLAKLWAAAGHHRTSPAKQANGFLSWPAFDPSAGPELLDEQSKLPAIRLWFGPRQDGYSTASSQENIYFAHVSTRLYSAGSHSLDPDEESIANTASRRMNGWWHRHFERVADFEQQYHVQNQIMKWSILTGWLLENELASALGSVQVRTDFRFDHWLSQTKDISFEHRVPFIPADQWSTGTECMEVLRSHPFASAGTIDIIEGGVSLGPFRSPFKGSRVTRSQGRSLRRARVDRVDSTSNVVRTVDGSHVEPPRFPTRALRIRSHPAKHARMRANNHFDPKLGNTAADFVSGRNQIRYAMTSNAGSIGSMTARKTSRGIELTWRNDVVARDKMTISRLSQLVSMDGGSAAKIASAPEFAPARGLYVMESSSGSPYIIRVPPARGGMVDASASGDARIYELGSKAANAKSSPINPDDVVLASVGHPRQLHIGLDKRGAPELREHSKLSELKAGVTSADHAHDLLSATPWQHVKVHGEHTGAITRVFSARGPPAGSRRIVIETGDPNAPQVVGFATKDMLYLKRPTSSSAHPAFNDLVTSRDLNGGKLRAILDSAAGGKTTYALPSRRPPSMPQEAVQNALGGDYQPLLTELRSAAQRGTLDQALRDVHALSRQHAISNLRSGRTITGARRYLARDYEHGPVDAVMTRALANVQARMLEDAARDLKAIAKHGNLQAAPARRMADALEAAGSGAAANYLRAQKGLLPDVGPDLAAHLSLTASRARLRMVLDMDGWKGAKARWTKLNAAGKDDLVRTMRSSGARVYLEPDVYLHGMPWDEAPGPTLSRVAADTRYTWDEMHDLPLGATRAHDVIAGGTRYRGVDVPAELANPQARAQATRIIRIRRIRPSNGNRCNQERTPCDLDCDGQVSSNERQQCGS